jgi:hypothetical protein
MHNLRLIEIGYFLKMAGYSENISLFDNISDLMQILDSKRYYELILDLRTFIHYVIHKRNTRITFDIIQEFRVSTAPLPQPFLFRFYRSNLAFMPYEEENQQTDETLVTINSDPKYLFFLYNYH